MVDEIVVTFRTMAQFHFLTGHEMKKANCSGIVRARQGPGNDILAGKCDA